VLVPTVMLEYVGRVPCRVGRVRKAMVTVENVESVSRVPHYTVAVHACGEWRDVAIERVTLDDGAPLRPVEGPRVAHYRGRPVRPCRPIVVEGVRYPTTSAAVAARGAKGVTDRLACQRVDAGWSGDRAVLTPSLVAGVKRGPMVKR